MPCTSVNGSKQGFSAGFLGIGFQLRDDILGVWGEAIKLGKAPNDLEEGRRTLPVALALEASLTIPGSVAELRQLIDTPSVRAQAEAATQRVTEEAQGHLDNMRLPGAWETAFRGLIGFVLTRNV